MYNTILIKRRLPDSLLDALPVLSGGELAFNEKNTTLYYGASSALGTTAIAIGGDGSFVNRTTAQTISGNKTFVNLTTLSSTTFSTNSVINVSSNTITNVGTPVNGTDAATKQYVLDQQSSIAGDFVNRTDAQDVSGVKTFFDNSIFRKNLTIVGNLSVLGDSTVVDTIVTATSAISITNAGTGPALTVTQTGANDIATFYDDATTALIIKDGGNIGIGINTPPEKLTVVGNVSATGNIFGVNGTFIGGLRVTQGATFVSNISGTQGSSQLYDFIIDCGSF
jgi:hypothetical protein